MERNFNTQLAGQIGESLVVAELGRRGIVATAFAGNVPDIDLLAYGYGGEAMRMVISGGIAVGDFNKIAQYGRRKRPSQSLSLLLCFIR